MGSSGLRHIVKRVIMGRQVWNKKRGPRIDLWEETGHGDTKKNPWLNVLLLYLKFRREKTEILLG